MPIRRDANAQRQRIVRSALAVLARVGFEGLSMRTVARESGCTIGLINHWFSSKEDLISEAWREAALRINRISREADGQGTSLRRLQQFLAVSPLQRRDQAVWLAFNAMTQGNRERRALQAQYYEEGRAYLVRQLKAAGTSTARASELAPAIMAALDGILYSAGIEPKFWSAARQRRTLAMLIGPLLPRKAKKRVRQRN